MRTISLFYELLIDSPDNSSNIYLHFPYIVNNMLSRNQPEYNDFGYYSVQSIQNLHRCVRIDNFRLKMIAKTWKKVHNSVDIKCSQIWSHFHGIQAFGVIWFGIVWCCAHCTLHMLSFVVRVCFETSSKTNRFPMSIRHYFKRQLLKRFDSKKRRIWPQIREHCILWCQ